ncbi:MAG: leucyl/phenylalanyl-tRNA--protein transferase [Shimia sp.]|uniref:leucyl/phenylalanyl-tRNA--protein transferase n=1 Tax=Shimia sp. TaxID=1954381 RepID=UPI0019EFC7A0|nr:leucyl/phenylalanyl-tRNA--protein transferase [Shimia sp.]MBE1292760.1 leucyl/phenylalanyl-tRNA--protein transferase [Paracoccaceae bacterium]MBO6898269.1 leucyl/phenylalanyl-tRNA--protein transferase [Shimia sp.]
MSEVTPDLLMRAYGMGVFPMSENRDDPDIFWVDPIRRGIFPLDSFHISRSLAKRIRRGGYTVSLNADFEGVLDGCADREETWINAQIRALYVALYARGEAHSLEVWDRDKLIGGVYGVTLGGAFFGESMFSRKTDASKIALAYLIEHLRRCGFTLFDTQFVTDHLISLGAIEIPRADYHKMLTWALRHDADITAHSLPSPSEVLSASA